MYDIVDMRDFLVGSENGGLYVNGTRKLYKYPDVNLITRMKLKNVVDSIHFSMEWYDNYNVIEIGHFYMTDPYENSQLEYLKKIKFDLNDNLILFIDDVSKQKNDKVLNVGRLKEDVEKILGRGVGIVYESEMKVFLDRTIRYLEVNFQVRKQGGKMYLMDQCIVSKKGDPTCFMYSLMWSLFRTGFYIGQSLKTLTIIDKKYEKLENKVRKYLKKPENSEYIYFDN